MPVNERMYTKDDYSTLLARTHTHTPSVIFDGLLYISI